MSKPYRIFRTEVLRAQRISPSFVRVTLAGPELAFCGATLLDQRVKLIFSTDPETLAGADDWYAAWRELPDERRPPMRTYTLRDVRPEAGEVDIDFACHGDAGPASRFALTAAPGQQVLLVGPDARVPGHDASGVAWQPGRARELLLVGDETAAPAICNILSVLPAEATGLAVIEVPHADDAQPVEAPDGVEVRWVARTGERVGDDATPHVLEWARQRTSGVPGEGVEETDRERDGLLIWEEASADEDRYAWLAGEAGWVTGLRRSLVNDLGLPRKQLSFMGYWKDGVVAVG